ncbi:RcnB family protein [Acinetobacter sp. YH12239]|uniref:RcnB family protein n=1 Tax=Acinetobacter sp. YH12239 TaxID=2601166 RepID=UPI0015D37F67|nr:RcnB family protein [Acinetobacter sp. YH12239]
MNNTLLVKTLLGSVILLITSHTFADSWANYQGSKVRPVKPTQTPIYTGNADRLSKPVPLQQPRFAQNKPQLKRPYPPYPAYPQQNGITVIYQQSLPTTTTYSSKQSSFVNGQGGTIEMSQYMLISDWRRYGLPAPQVGMHWIYQNGRYIQMPNDR